MALDGCVAGWAILGDVGVGESGPGGVVSGFYGGEPGGIDGKDSGGMDVADKGAKAGEVVALRAVGDVGSAGMRWDGWMLGLSSGRR